MPALTLVNGLLRVDGCGGPLVISELAQDPCCCDPCPYIVCISVIDEDDSNGNRDLHWAQFRAAWPDRKFFLLRPLPTSFGDLVLPAGWDGTGPLVVGRPGEGGATTDWYDVCNLDVNLSRGGKIALFVDNSGSMTTDTVRASYDLFLNRLANRTVNGVADPVTQANERLILVENPSEEWILPHIEFVDCPVPLYSPGGNWCATSSWYFDAAFTRAANRIPTINDIVHIYGSMTSDGTCTAEAKAVYVY